jgi:hypothetical protein
MPDTDQSRLDDLTNLGLIENGLLHMQFELQRGEPSHFRVAREAHLVLYRTMIEVLRGTNNFAVTGQPSKDRSFRFERGNGRWREIQRTEVAGCEKAWRFGEPIPCSPPNVAASKISDSSNNDFLIGFYDALARIQTECFMARFVGSKWSSVSDQDMRILEWLHESVRNEYEHFVPTLYLAAAAELLAASALALGLAGDLLFTSGNVSFHSIREAKLNALLQSVLEEITTQKN